MPTLLMWGDREPLGDVGVARAVVDRIPRAELALVPAGHAPWIGRADQTAERLTDFVLRRRS